MASVWNTVAGLRDRAIALNAQKYSRPAIAETLYREFGVAVSTNSITGELWRLGHQRPKTYDRVPKATKAKRGRSSGANDINARRRLEAKQAKLQADLARRAKLQEDAARAKQRIVVEDAPVLEYEKATVPDQHMKLSTWGRPTISLTELNGDRCHWPFDCDDGSVRFCGERARIMCYCTYHAGRAFNLMPTEKRNAASPFSQPAQVDRPSPSHHEVGSDTRGPEGEGSDVATVQEERKADHITHAFLYG